MIIDETPVWEQVQDLIIANWTTIEEEQLTKGSLVTKISYWHVPQHHFVVGNRAHLFVVEFHIPQEMHQTFWTQTFLRCRIVAL
jgi:photosystem II stability/assembly factor-like uncharacterized protein